MRQADNSWRIARAGPWETSWVASRDELDRAVDEAWARALGCPVALLREPGVHLVPGGPVLNTSSAVLLVRLDTATLVYCPASRHDHARAVIAAGDPATSFTPELCARIAGVPAVHVLGPARHGFVNGRVFRPATDPIGRILPPDDPRLGELRRACGEGQWDEAGFSGVPDAFDGLVYGVDHDGRLVAAGNLTSFREVPADVGLLTHPDHRGRGLATRLATRMVLDALSAAGIVRYRTVATNTASLRIGATLGFRWRGQNLIARR
jgi:GNAT superfamily N-acetyltransferase